MSLIHTQDLPSGIKYFRGYFSREEQLVLLDAIRDCVKKAPLFVPTMPKTGRPMHVRSSNCGELGWVTDKEQGYRYQPTHPVTGELWPPIPQQLLDVWRKVSDYPNDPQGCLINFYAQDAKMGMHQDRDELELKAPVVSVSLGDSCLFRIGNVTKGGKTQSIRLESGDVFVFGGASRLIYHGVDRIYPDTSDLLKQGGRINLTMRRITAP